MLKRQKDMHEQTAAPMVLPTAEVFVRGAPVYIRFTDWANQQKMVLADCLGLQGNSNVLSLSWNEAAAQVSAPPALGARVLCYTIVAGVLYTVSGRISGQVEAQRLRLDLAVDGNCQGVNLRRHTRFSASGTLTLRRAGATDVPQEFTPSSLDLSPGGMGVVLRDGGWQTGDSLEFALAFTPEQRDGGTLEFSTLDLSGTLVIRKRTELPEPDLVRLGCEFTQIAELDERLLKLLVSTHGAALRKG